MRIKSRFYLVALVVATQAVAVGLGVFWATRWLGDAFAEVVHNHVATAGAAQAHELAVKAADLRLEDVEPGGADWRQLQELCRQATIPHEGFACVFRRDSGAMLCHPDLEERPSLLQQFPGHATLSGDLGVAPITQVIRDAEAAGSHVVTGKVDVDGQLHVFTGFSTPRLNAVMAVYQSDMAIEALISSVIWPVLQVGYALMALVVGGTAIVTAYLVDRYEAGLDEIHAGLEEQVAARTKSLLQTRNAVVFGLSKLVESRDRDVGDHLERIRSYVTILATELAKTNPEIDHRYVADLATASLLHDIGKVGVPDSVLRKTGTLTPTERRAMEFHTILGSECLAAMQSQLDDDTFVELAQQIAVGHHEQWDGNGYPHGLGGKQIPLAARIVALADVYDALTTSRPYKGPVSHAETRDWIATRYATHFDPAIVEAFIAREQDFMKVCQSYRQLAESANTKGSATSMGDEPAVAERLAIELAGTA